MLSMPVDDQCMVCRWDGQDPYATCTLYSCTHIWVQWFQNQEYCIISTKCSWGVMCDAHEHYLAKFMGKILAMTGTKSIHFSPK